MALLQDGRGAPTLTAVETKTKAIRTTNAPRGLGYSASSTTGTIAAAAAAGGCYFAIRNSASAGNYFIFIERIRLDFTTIANFSTSVVAGRRLSIYRGSGSATSGGTALSPVQKDPSATLSYASASNGGDIRVATTGTLGITGITWEAQPFREMSLSHLGTSAATAGQDGNDENIFDFATTSPIILQPGQLIGIRNPQAMDAGGTWQIQVDFDWHESVGWSSTVVD